VTSQPVKDRATAREDEDEGERLDRELLELLNELRVAMPGVQILFGFLLTVPFQQRFADVTAFQRDLYLVCLLLAAGAGALLIAPTAHHRLTFREGQKPRLVKLGTHYAIGGLVLLALAMTATVMLVTDVLFQDLTVAIVVAAVAGLFAWLWFAMPLLQRARGSAW
jgi:hypothetical protein